MLKSNFNQFHKQFSENLPRSLERTISLLDEIGNPQNKLRIITVGGTNAKGSTCFNLSYNLTQNGIKTGCFTSPHIHSIRERIRISDNMISKTEFTYLINMLKEITLREKIEAT